MSVKVASVGFCRGAYNANMDDLVKHQPLSFGLRTLIVSLVLAVSVSLLLILIVKVSIYSSHRNNGRRQIDSIAQRISLSLPPPEQEVVVFWTPCAYGNVCFSPDEVSLTELKRFNEDVRLRAKGSVDLATADWIWRRLAETGPHGAKYVARFEPKYRKELADASRPHALTLRQP